jgi:hypothetical protein
MWGFWDGAHWKHNAPLYRKDWSLKPAGVAFRDLVLKTWRTDEAGKTGLDGVLATRGFFGDYDVEVRASGKQKTVKTTLGAPGAVVTVVLE